MSELRERLRDATSVEGHDASLEEVFLKVTDEGAAEPQAASTP